MKRLSMLLISFIVFLALPVLAQQVIDIAPGESTDITITTEQGTQTITIQAGTCPTPQPCPSSSPCPTQIPCPSQSPCPTPAPCPTQAPCVCPTPAPPTNPPPTNPPPTASPTNPPPTPTPTQPPVPSQIAPVPNFNLSIEQNVTNFLNWFYAWRTPQGIRCDRVVSPGQNLQSAHNNASNGQTICVREGTYENADLDITKSVTFISHPDNTTRPVLQCNSPTNSNNLRRVEIFNSARDAKVIGFVIDGCWDGIKNWGYNSTIQYNLIKDPIYMGILTLGNDKLNVYGNVITNVGRGYGRISGFSPKNAHGIYVGNDTCAGYSGAVIEGNLLVSISGRGVQFNGNWCGSNDWLEDSVVKNNIMSGTSYCLITWTRTRNIEVSGNDCSTQGHPPTNETEHFAFRVYNSRDIDFRNNRAKYDHAGNTCGGLVFSEGSSGITCSNNLTSSY